MNNTAAIIGLILSAIPLGEAAVGAVIDDLKQQGELTEEQATALHAKREAAFASDRWATDDEIAAGKPPVDTAPGNG